MIPIVYRWLAVVGLLMAAVAFGWVKGSAHVQTQWDAAIAAQNAHVALVQRKQAESTVKVVTKYVDRVQTVYRTGQTITKEVPVYVPATTPDLPGGFRLLHDAAATGSKLDASGIADAAPVPAATAAETVSQNYTICRATAEQLKALQEWIVEQQKAINSK